jgi:hypothetical protein
MNFLVKISNTYRGGFFYEKKKAVRNILSLIEKEI